MNPYTLDFSKYYDDIVSALKVVFGYEYSNIIDERFNSIIVTTYSNYKGINYYYKFLEDAKSRELCIKFLKRIGINVDNDISFADKFTGELDELVKNYLQGEYAFKETFQMFPDTFRSFFCDESELCYKEKILENRIRFINFIRNSNFVTKDNFDEFIKTEEYKKIILLCKKYNEIYEELSDEMNLYMESIKGYKEYYKTECFRRDDIIKRKTIELCDEIKKMHFEGLNKEDIDVVFNNLLNGLIDCKMLIEYFSLEDELKISDINISLYDKKWILYYRKKFFVNMGINIDPWNDDYYEVIKREDVKRIIPSKEMVDEIKKLRLIKLEEATKEFICESDTFKRAIKNFSDNEVTREYIYRIIKNNRVCVHAGNVSEKFIPLVFLTLRQDECGCFDYVILHEIIHAIESEGIGNGNYRCGFEPCIFHGEKSSHIYFNSKRKYERMNETITDMFAIEALEILHSLEIYIADEKDITKRNILNRNTSIILKEMLRPFIDKYRSLIINARICGTISELKLSIGDDNFEILNDIIDYVDMLIDMGLENKLNNSVEDNLVLEYKEQLKKLENVYKSMDECYSNYIAFKLLKKK